MAKAIVGRLCVFTLLTLLLLPAGAAEACSYRSPWVEAALQQRLVVTTGSWLHATDPSRAETLGSCAGDRVALLVQDMTLTLKAGGVVLLGEVHDNPRQHALRALMIEALAAERPALVFEQIRADQRPALDSFQAQRASGQPATASGLFGLLEWEKTGWPDQALYEPLFAAAIAASLPILPGDPPRGRTREIARGGLDVVATDERARLKLDIPLPPPLGAALAAELKASHCGLLPDSAIPGLALAQRYRDAHLADALTGTNGPAVLIAGNGHVRSDRGVPWHIRQRSPGRNVVTVMLVEVESGSDPDARVPRDPDGKPAADFVIFTPPAERKDPCDEMRRSQGKP